MAGARRARLLLVVWEAAEKSLVRRLLDDGRLPTLSALIDRGGLVDVDSSPGQLSGSVWPTFVTGTDPEVHGAIGEWRWHPDEMRLRHYSGADLRPFWSALSGRGVSVGVVDIPGAMPAETGPGFRVTEWGAHDRFLGRTVVEPVSLVPVVRRHPKHPFAGEPRRPVRRDDVVGLSRIARRCADGLALRVDLVLDLLQVHPVDLAVVACPELHVAGHLLWHTLEDASEALSGLARSLPDLYMSADQQLARLVEGCGPETAVIVTSFHGMRRGSEGVTLLEPLLADLALTAPAPTPIDVRRTALPALLPRVKRAVPESLRFSYRRRVPFALQRRVAEQTSTPANDWSRTEAFMMCRDHPTWVRLNLQGRERDGIVPAAAFHAKREAVAAGLLSSRSPSGAHMIEEAVHPTEQPHRYLPDLLVTWGPGAEDYGTAVSTGQGTRGRPTGHRTGTHRGGGWAVGLAGVGDGKIRLAQMAERCERVLRQL